MNLSTWNWWENWCWSSAAGSWPGWHGNQQTHWKGKNDMAWVLSGWCNLANILLLLYPFVLKLDLSRVNSHILIIIMGWIMSYTYLYIYLNLKKMNFIFCLHGEKDLKRTVSKLPHPTWVMVHHTFKALQFQNSCVSILNLILYLKLHSSLLCFFVG